MGGISAADFPTPGTLGQGADTGLLSKAVKPSGGIQYASALNPNAPSGKPKNPPPATGGTSNSGTNPNVNSGIGSVLGGNGSSYFSLFGGRLPYRNYDL